MAYHKFKADQIFSGSELITGDNVLICKDDGTVENLVSERDAGEEIKTLSGILSPGFINSHCHLELSYLKGAIPEKTGMIDFLFGVINKRNFSEELKQAAIEAGEQEMIRNGIVAVGDICNGTDSLHQKQKSNLIYRNFIETAGFPETVAIQRLNNSQAVSTSFKKELGMHSLVNIVPHAPYSVSPRLLKLINSLPDNFHLTIHNQETPDENQFTQSKSGPFLRLYDELGIDIESYIPSGFSSFQSFLPEFSRNQSFIFVHNVSTSEQDLQFAHDYSGISFEKMFWCLCPNANEYINGSFPDISLLEKYQCQIVVGTDSLASNHQLDLLSELRSIRKRLPKLNLESLLRWSTLNGAKALGLDSYLGSFSNGKRPGVLLLDDDLKGVERVI